MAFLPQILKNVITSDTATDIDLAIRLSVKSLPASCSSIKTVFAKLIKRMITKQTNINIKLMTVVLQTSFVFCIGLTAMFSQMISLGSDAL